MIVAIFLIILIILLTILILNFKNKKEGMVVFGKHHADPDEDLTDYDNLFKD